MKHIRLFFIWHIVYQRKRMTPLAFLKSVDDMIFWNPQRRQLISEIIIYSVFALKCTTKIKWGYSNYCGIHLGKQVEEKKYESIWAIWIIRFKGPNKETHLKKKNAFEMCLLLRRIPSWQNGHFSGAFNKICSCHMPTTEQMEVKKINTVTALMELWYDTFSTFFSE